MLRPSVLVLAVLLSCRAWWGVLVTQNQSLVHALIWFLVAVPVAALMLAGLRYLTDSYRRSVKDEPAPRRD